MQDGPWPGGQSPAGPHGRRLEEDALHQVLRFFIATVAITATLLLGVRLGTERVAAKRPAGSVQAAKAGLRAKLRWLYALSMSFASASSGLAPSSSRRQSHPSKRRSPCQGGGSGRGGSCREGNERSCRSPTSGLSMEGTKVRPFICGVAAVPAAAILVPALWTEPAAAAHPCPPKPWCRTSPVCVHWGGCGHLGNGCMKWSCRDFNTQTKEPLKPPKPLPGSRRIPWGAITR